MKKMRTVGEIMKGSWEEGKGIWGRVWSDGERGNSGITDEMTSPSEEL